MIASRVRAMFGAVVLCVVLCSAFISLGRWQWRVAFADQQRLSDVVTTKVVPLDARSLREQWLPRTSIGALVGASGKFDDRRTFTTHPRPTSQGNLPWMVTPFELVDGSVIAVVNGVDDAGRLNQLTPIGSQPTTITGRLQPSEDSPAAGAWQPTVPELSTNALVDRWPYPVVRDGYLVRTQSLAKFAHAEPILRFTSAPSGSIGWRSIAYAFQWWSFAAFTLFVFIRQVATRPQTDRFDAAP